MFCISRLLLHISWWMMSSWPLVYCSRPDQTIKFYIVEQKSLFSKFRTYCEGSEGCCSTLLLVVRLVGVVPIMVAMLSAEVASWATSVMLSWEMVV